MPTKEEIRAFIDALAVIFMTLPERIRKIRSYLSCTTTVIDTLSNQCVKLLTYLPDVENDDGVNLVYGCIQISDELIYSKARP